MKAFRILIIFMVLTTTILANPRDRRHHRPVRHHYHPHSYYRVHPYPSHYFGRAYYSPVVIRTHTTTTTTTPQNLVTMTAEMVAEDLIRVNGMHAQGLITDKEFGQVRKTLLGRIGMQVNPEASGLTTSEVLDQIEVVYGMMTGQLITAKEYKKQKRSLLAMI